MKNINCYIHIPFCTNKCKYCRFASFWWLKDNQIDNYIKFLCDEIESKYNNNYILDTIYFWWWTPWILTLKQFKKILNTLKKKYIFSGNIEISIETTPENISYKNLIWWKKLWINRISIWIQTLNNKTLSEIWRSWKKEIFKALDYINDIWFENIAIDFILWLPYVEKREVLNDVDFLIKKYDFIKHISLYMLEEYYDIPEKNISKFDNVIYPEDWKNNWLEEIDFLEEYKSIKNYLLKSWFERYEISNFAKTSFKCVHNKWYWDHKDNLAFWLWSHWYVNNIRFFNSDNILDYYNNKNIISENIDKNDFFIEKIMFDLRTNWINKTDLCRLDNDKIKDFIKSWYLYESNNEIILADKWVLVLDYILKEIL